MQDHISNLISVFKNSITGNNLKIFYSKSILGIINILSTYSYIESYNIIKVNKTSYIKISLLKVETINSIELIEFKVLRLSKPSKRMYCSYKDVLSILKKNDFKNGLGILSTSSGLMSHHDAMLHKKGGEFLLMIK